MCPEFASTPDDARIKGATSEGKKARALFLSLVESLDSLSRARIHACAARQNKRVHENRSILSFSLARGTALWRSGRHGTRHGGAAGMGQGMAQDAGTQLSCGSSRR